MFRLGFILYFVDLSCCYRFNHLFLINVSSRGWVSVTPTVLGPVYTRPVSRSLVCFFFGFFCMFIGANNPKNCPFKMKQNFSCYTLCASCVCICTFTPLGGTSLFRCGVFLKTCSETWFQKGLVSDIYLQ